MVAIVFEFVDLFLRGVLQNAVLLGNSHENRPKSRAGRVATRAGRGRLPKTKQPVPAGRLKALVARAAMSARAFPLVKTRLSASTGRLTVRAGSVPMAVARLAMCVGRKSAGVGWMTFFVAGQCLGNCHQDQPRQAHPAETFGRIPSRTSGGQPFHFAQHRGGTRVPGRQRQPEVNRLAEGQTLLGTPRQCCPCQENHRPFPQTSARRQLNGDRAPGRAGEPLRPPISRALLRRPPGNRGEHHWRRCWGNSSVAP